MIPSSLLIWPDGLRPQGEVMDSATIALIALAVLALVAIAGFRVYRKKVKVGIKGPGGTGLDFEGSNEGDPDRRDPDRPGVRVKDVRSHEGGLTAADRTGRGADVEGADVKKDIRVSSDPGPKAGPPA
jgi:hypothetical protein